MIDYETMTVTLGTKTEKILEFKVYWMTPFGMCETLEQAKEKLESSDMPVSILRPVVVADCENGLYEPVL